MKIYVSKDQFEQAVLFKLFEEANREGNPKAQHEIEALFTVEVPQHRLKLAIESLYDEDLLSRQETSNGWELYIISNKGLRRIEANLGAANSFLSTYWTMGDEWLFSNATRIAPASDRIVSLTDNQTTVDEIRSKLDAIASELTTSNESGDIFGNDRDQALQEVSVLRTMLNAARLRLGAFVTLARSTLGWISEKGGGAVIGELAKTALKHILNWF